MPTTTRDGRCGAKGPLPPSLPATVKHMGLGVIRGKIGGRNAEILGKYFALGYPHRQTLAAIGQDYGISRERVRQIVQRALFLLGVSP